MNRRQTFFMTIIILVASLGGARSGSTCEPCHIVLDLDTSAAQADLIIIGRRTDYDPSEVNDVGGGPDTVHVEILDVMKGQVAQTELTVNSWDAMCDYGIVVDDQPYVMLLQQRGEIYDAVNFGCSVKTLAMEDGSVEAEGERVSFTVLKARFRGQGQE